MKFYICRYLTIDVSHIDFFHVASFQDLAQHLK